MKKKIFQFVVFFSTLTICPTVFAASASFSWLPNSESNIGGYIIYYGLTSQNYEFEFDVGNLAPTSGRIHCNVTGLENNTLYYFVVVAYTDTGTPSDPSWELTYFTPPPSNITSFPTWSLYLNNDPIQDTVYVDYDGVYAIYGSENETKYPIRITTGFAIDNGWNPKNHIIIIDDINNDDIKDIIGFGNPGLIVAYGIDGYSFEPATRIIDSSFSYNAGWRNDMHQRGISDIDGDGIKDVWGFGNPGLIVAYGIDGYSFEPATRIIDSSFSYNAGWRNDMHQRGISDIDGDGIKDVWGFGNPGLIVACGIGGYSFENPVLLLDGSFGYNQGWKIENNRQFIDVNSDGYLDISGWKNGVHWVSLSVNGEYFEDAIQWH